MLNQYAIIGSVSKHDPMDAHNVFLLFLYHTRDPLDFFYVHIQYELIILVLSLFWGV